LIEKIGKAKKKNTRRKNRFLRVLIPLNIGLFLVFILLVYAFFFAKVVPFEHFFTHYSMHWTCGEC